MHPFRSSLTRYFSKIGRWLSCAAIVSNIFLPITSFAHDHNVPRGIRFHDVDAPMRELQRQQAASSGGFRGHGLSGPMQMMGPGRHMQSMNMSGPINFHQNPQAFLQTAFGALNHQLGNRSAMALPAHFETLNLSLAERLNIGSERLRLEMAATSAAEDARRERLRMGQIPGQRQSFAGVGVAEAGAALELGSLAGAAETLGTIGGAIMSGLGALLYAPLLFLSGDTPIDEHGRALPPPSMRGASDAEEMRQEGIERMVDQFSRSQALPLVPESAPSTAQLIPSRPQFAEVPPADARMQDLLRMHTPDVRLSSGMSVGALAQITFDPDAGRPIIHGTPAEGLRLPQLTGFPISEQQRPIALITPLPDQEHSQVESFPAHDPLGGVAIHTQSRDDSLIDRFAAIQLRTEQEEGDGAAAAGTSAEGEVVPDLPTMTDEQREFFEKHGKVPVALVNEDQLLQSIADRAAKAIPGSGPQVGIARHQYAEELLQRYQKGDNRGLQTEQRYIDGAEWQSGDGVQGSRVLDVFNPDTEVAHDYKFGSARMSTQQREGIKQAADAKEVRVVRPSKPDGQ